VGSKKLCKLAKKDYHNDKTKKFAKLVDKPKYFCKKCGRVSNNSDNLCNSKKLSG
jgi:hypothetical protein